MTSSTACDNRMMVSVVIPVYNAEKTVSKCLDSILQQSYHEYEVVIIDDGSTDGTADICLDYCNRYQGRIRYNKQKNSGPSAARNLGIRNSKGKYIAFVDSDDTVDAEMIGTMLAFAEKHNAEMVICSYWMHNCGKINAVRFAYPEGFYQGGDAKTLAISLLNMNDNEIKPYSWLRLTRKTVFTDNDLWFNEKLIRSEDYHLWTRVHFLIDRAYYLSQTQLYHYIDNSGSITRSYVKNYWNDLKTIFNDLSRVLPQEKEVVFGLNNMLFRRSMNALSNAARCRSIRAAAAEIKSILYDRTFSASLREKEIKNYILDHSSNRQIRYYRLFTNTLTKPVLMALYLYKAIMLKVLVEKGKTAI